MSRPCAGMRGGPSAKLFEKLRMADSVVEWHELAASNYQASAIGQFCMMSGQDTKAHQSNVPCVFKYQAQSIAPPPHSNHARKPR